MKKTNDKKQWKPAPWLDEALLQPAEMIDDLAMQLAAMKGELKAVKKENKFLRDLLTTDFSERNNKKINCDHKNCGEICRGGINMRGMQFCRDCNQWIDFETRKVLPKKR